MTRPIEAVVAEAQERLQRDGRLDVKAFAAAHPEYRTELEELLPVMLQLEQERRWRRAEAQSRSFAHGLFRQLAPAARPTSVGELFRREQAEAGLTPEEQARRSGLPVDAIRRLSQEETPVEQLDNAAIRQLASRVAAPFTALLKEIRRLTSLDALTRSSGPAAVFTRDRETSSDAEREALRKRVQEAARRPPEER